MAKRKLIAQINAVNCKLCKKDMLVTKPDLALTPMQVKELTDKGIAVSLPNSKQFLDGQNAQRSNDWSVDPIFRPLIPDLRKMPAVPSGSYPYTLKGRHTYPPHKPPQHPYR